MYMDISRHKDGKGKTPICLKDTVSYETGKWKNHEMLLFFINFSAN